MSDSIVLKDIITATSPLIKSVVDIFLAPKLEKLKNRLSVDYKKYIIPTEAHFKEYFFRSYKKYSVLNTLVFSNSQRLLKDVYIPLTLRLSSEKDIKYSIDGFPIAIVSTYKKVLITDTAGMGKSTMMKRIFLDIIDNSRGIPIMIELRRLSKEKRLIQELHEQLNSINKGFDEKLLLELIREGDFIFILDGYDEIPLADREIVTFDIQSFVSKAGNNQFLLTSRPENALSSFGDFQQFTIQPLKRKEAFELLRKYDKQGEVSSLLIKKLEGSELNNIEEFLANPLLVSLLFTAFEHKQVIPFKKHIFYRQVYDANFESHDLTKGDSYNRNKYCSLDIDEFHRVLRHLGFSCLKQQKIEYTKDEILNLITAAKRFCSGIDFQSSDFLKDLINTVPLFTQDGIYFRWAHKSLQEYFAAQFIYLDSKEHQKEILQKLIERKNIEKFLNILNLYYDIDYKTFRNTIIYSLLKEFKEYCDSSYQYDYGVDKAFIIERQELTFCTGFVLFKATIADHQASFNDKNLDNLIEKIKNNSKLDTNEVWRMWYSGKKNNHINVIELYNSRKVLLSILRSKNDKILKPVRDAEYNRIPPSRPLKYFKITEYDYELVDDNPEKDINFPEYFEDINLLLIHYNNISGIRLDYENSMLELENIQKELANEIGNDFLLSGF